MKEKKAFIFFNCDEDKSQKSMNVFYNQEIYRDLKVARKALLTKVEEEQAEGRIHIAEDNVEVVRQAIPPMPRHSSSMAPSKASLSCNPSSQQYTNFISTNTTQRGLL